MMSMPTGAAVPFVEQRMLTEDLRISIARAVDADLRAVHQAVTKLETDLRAGVEAEEIVREIAEVAMPRASG